MEATSTPSKPAIESIGELAEMVLRVMRVWAATDPDVPTAIKNEILKQSPEGSNHAR